MDKTLVTMALFSAIFADSGKDYLDIITPFVEYVLEGNYNKGDVIEETLVQEALINDFLLIDFPVNITKSILEKLRKTNKLIKKNNKFIMNASFLESKNEFMTNKKDVNILIESVLSKLTKYLTKELHFDYSIEETNKIFESFLSQYGYDTFFNYSSSRKLISNSKNEYYVIGKYIKNTFDDKLSNDFNNIMKIIQGYMLADAVYLQVDRKNIKHLKTLKVYLDGPFLLRVLGLKSELENKGAQELIQKLKKFNCSLMVFDHTRDEIADIMYWYAHNLNNRKLSTIEYFDEHKYTQGQILEYLNDIDFKIKGNNIQIINKPDFDEKFVIDEKKLEQMLNGNGRRRNIGEKAIERDICSVRSINTLREGINHQRIEEAKHIFLTTYSTLKYASDQIRDDCYSRLIGPVILDLDLSTILWIKDASVNKDLPKMKLLEISMSAINPSSIVIEKAQMILKELEDKSNEDDLAPRLTIHYLMQKGFMEVVKNDERLVTKEAITTIINQDSSSILDLQKMYHNLKSEQEIIVESRDEIIEEKAEEVYKKCKIKASVFFSVIAFIACLILFLTMINNTNFNKWYIFVGATFLFCINIFLLIVPQIKFTKKMIDKYAIGKKYKFIKKEQKNFEKKLENKRTT